MRARKKKNTGVRIDRCASFRTEQIEPTEKPLHLELGCGKGNFIVRKAELYPDVMFYAMEKVPDVLVMAMEKASVKNPSNLKFLLGDAFDLCDREEQVYSHRENGEPIFETKTIKALSPDHVADVIYLNFSDPWPKKRDETRRLTHRNFLKIYQRILKPDGHLEIKTDNQKLFLFTLDELREVGFTLYDLTEDLHHSTIQNDSMTEYEERFSSQGMPIYHVKAKMN